MKNYNQMTTIQFSKLNFNSAKLNVEDLYFNWNDTDIVFTYKGRPIAELSNNGKVKYFDKVEKSISKEISSTIQGLLNNTLKIVTSLAKNNRK